jgi:hypothetical protein
MIKNCIQTYAGSSPTALINIVQQMQKGAEMMLHNRTLLAAQLLHQEAVATSATERKSQKQKRIQKGGTLSKEEADDIIAQREALALAAAERREERHVAGAAQQCVQVCTACRNPRHNRRTYTINTA